MQKYRIATRYGGYNILLLHAPIENDEAQYYECILSIQTSQVSRSNEIYECINESFLVSRKDICLLKNVFEYESDYDAVIDCIKGVVKDKEKFTLPRRKRRD